MEIHVVVSALQRSTKKCTTSSKHLVTAMIVKLRAPGGILSLFYRAVFK